MTMRHITYLVYLLASFVGPGALLTMLSENQSKVLSAGEPLVLDCDFRADNYNLFDYPVLWRKSQLGEKTQVNIMGNVNEPYMASNRFEVAFTSTPPRFRLELTIVDVSADDSGNYTCEVRGPQSVVLGRITHYVYVKMPVHRVVISDDNFVTEQSSTPASIHVVDGRPSTLRCVAFGGYPPPSVELFVDRRDVTAQFEFAHNASLTGRRGLRRIVYRSERWTYGYLPDAGDDQARLKCFATVVGIKSYFETVLLSIDYAPKISCVPAAAHVGDRNVEVSCTVLAKPPVTAMFWFIDANGTTVPPSRLNVTEDNVTEANITEANITSLTDAYLDPVDDNGTSVSEGDHITDHWTKSETSNGAMKSTLHIRLMTPDMFRRYTFVAENSVSVSTRDVTVTQKEVPPQLREAEVPSMVGDKVKSKHRVASYDSKPSMAGDNVKSKHRVASYDSKTSSFFTSRASSKSSSAALFYVAGLTHAYRLFGLRSASVL